MSSSSKQKSEELAAALPADRPLPSRKLRHSRKRRSGPLANHNRLALLMGIFGVLIAGAIAYEIVQANKNRPALSVQATTEMPQETSQHAPAVPKENEGENEHPDSQSKATAESPAAPHPTGTSGPPLPKEQLSPTDAGPAAAEPVRSKEQKQLKVKRHVVKQGETLYQLSRLYYGNQTSVKRIARYNGISPEAKLTVGQVISIPSPAR
ncbi:LysM peptidoglycan-binding domain-containing protein [Brevibacillus massiliensis]|jgi:nucleoid-associated protein YgaU|uniref:LysM peptidoglycan-binding domain-containing protein n=1 Tax=Brevibacillus massiliensis TaxID=1118054 RepID=UPI0002E426DD|nr:LysM peptidoglycan-binding domain-containing protein [Brevibacillus massiliensis]